MWQWRWSLWGGQNESANVRWSLWGGQNEYGGGLFGESANGDGLFGAVKMNG